MFWAANRQVADEHGRSRHSSIIVHAKRRKRCVKGTIEAFNNTRNSMPEARQTKTQKRVVKVLERMISMAQQNEDDAEMFADGLEDMLSDIHGNDGFGTEGQCDPRGDFRNGRWSMTNVEGV